MQTPARTRNQAPAAPIESSCSCPQVLTTIALLGSSASALRDDLVIVLIVALRRRGGRENASPAVHSLPSDDRSVHLDVHDLVRVDVMRIFLEHDEVRELAGGDGSLQVLLRRGVRAVDRRDRE